MWGDYKNITGIKPKENLIGKTQGELTIIGYERRLMSKGLTGHWVCRCSCDKIVYFRGGKTFTNKIACASCSLTIRGRDRRGGKYKTILNYSKLKRIFYKYKKSAKTRGIYFNLTEEEFFKTINKDCNYCGISPQVLQATDTLSNIDGVFKINGVDRLDSSEGYTISNIVPCCKFCNYAKKEYSLESFMSWVERICKFQSKF